jgi:hypothetical protein
VAVTNAQGVTYTWVSTVVSTESASSTVDNQLAAPTQSATNGATANVGAIAGGTVGGVVALVIVAILLFLLRKKRSTMRNRIDLVEEGADHFKPSPPEQEPIYLITPYVSATLGGGTSNLNAGGQAAVEAVDLTTEPSDKGNQQQLANDTLGSTSGLVRAEGEQCIKAEKIAPNENSQYASGNNELKGALEEGETLPPDYDFAVRQSMLVAATSADRPSSQDHGRSYVHGK